MTISSKACVARDAGNSTVAGLILGLLRSEKVSKIFGIPGGATMHLMNELKVQNADLDFIICRHETGAAYIAHGYSLASGSNALGVVLTTSGPAATNALTGALNAQASGVPLLVITGEVPQQYFGRGYLQEGIDSRLDVDAVFKNSLRYSAVITSKLNVLTLFTRALREARSIPYAAAHVSIPNDVAGEKLDGVVETLPAVNRNAANFVDLGGIERAFHALAKSKRPLFFLGNGARNALSDKDRRDRLKKMAHRFAIPVMTTPDAKGIFPETDALSLRNYGVAGCPWPDRYIDHDGDRFDALCVIGSRLGELATSVKLSALYATTLIPRETFVQIDVDERQIGCTFPVTQGVVSDAGAAIDRMCELGEALQPPADAEERRKLIDTIKATPEFDVARESTCAPLHPAALIRVINEEVECGHVFIDAGNCVGWSLNNLIVDPPLVYHSALDMGPMGFAVGAVIGGRLADETRPSIALVGDGAFMMHGAEISTAAQHQIGAIWIVLNDNDLAMVSQGMSALFKSVSWLKYYELGNPDLVKFAEGLGARAVLVTREQGPEAFREALRCALAGGMKGQPQAIIVDIDTAPMPPYCWPTS